MTAEIIFFILFLGIIIGLLRWSLNKRKDFKDIIEPKLKLHRLKFVSSVYPGFFEQKPTISYSSHLPLSLLLILI